MVISEIPHSAAHSEYHIYLLFSDCISVISKITNNIVHTEVKTFSLRQSSKEI